MLSLLFRPPFLSFTDMQSSGSLGSSREAQRTVTWLLRVCTVVVSTWIVARSFDCNVFMKWMVDGTVPPHNISAIREFSLRLSGLVDVFLFSRICETCLMGVGSRRRNSVISSVPRDMSVSRWSTADGGLGDPYPPSMPRHKPPTSTMSRMVGASLFCTSWNMGGRSGQDLDQVIPTWIPQGYDLYAIAFQECTCLKQARAAIHDSLGE